MRLARDVGGAFDGPTLLRDMSSLGSPIRVGLSFILLNLILGGLLGAMILCASSGVVPFAMASQHLGLGQFLAGTLMVGIGGVLTLLIPMRSVGGFEVPRWGNYFDQVVMSGISPSRYLGGKLAAQNVFFWLVVVAALPYGIFSLSLGGTEPGYVLRALLALWLYANLLTIVTVAGGAFFNEVGAGVSAILLFGLLYLFALGPLPPYVGAVVPSHALVDPFWKAMTELGFYNEEWPVDTLMLRTRWGVVGLDSWQTFVLGAVAAGSLALGAALLGPVRCIVGETSAFGEVVMQGDSKKAGLLRRHKMLQRRTEMAFFYENRADVLVRWEAPLRYVWVLACFALPCVIVWLSLHQSTISINPSEWYLANVLIFCAMLVAGALAFTGDKAILRTRLAAGDRTFSVAALNAAGFAVVCALCFVGGHLFALSIVEGGETSWMARVKEFPTLRRPLRLGLQLQSLCPLFLAMAVQFYAMLYLLSARVWLRGSALLGAGAALGMLWLVPYGTAMTYADFYRYHPAVLPKLIMLAELSPMPLVELMAESPGRFMREYVSRGNPTRSVLYQWTITGVLVLWAFWYHGVLQRRETGVAAPEQVVGDVPAEPEPEPEPDTPEEQTS